jgi:hypothetical protein
MKRRHDGDLMKIHTEYVRGEGQPEEEEAATEALKLGVFYRYYG